MQNRFRMEKEEYIDKIVKLAGEIEDLKKRIREMEGR